MNYQIVFPSYLFSWQKVVFESTRRWNHKQGCEKKTTCLTTNKKALNVNETHFVIFKPKNIKFKQHMTDNDWRATNWTSEVYQIFRFVYGSRNFLQIPSDVRMKLCKLMKIITITLRFIQIWYTVTPVIWTNTYPTKRNLCTSF